MSITTRNQWTPLFEVWLSWRFVRNNIWTTIVPLPLFTLGLSVATGQPSLQTISGTVISFTYFFLFLYVCEINTQITGVEEDKINKPDRPIASGIITLQQGKFRAVISSSMFIAYALILNVGLWALLWFGLVWLYSYAGCSRHWLLKCLFASIGSQTQLPVAAIIAGVPLHDLWVWLFSIFIMMTILVGVQEFHDVEGDKRVGRVTLPLRFGVRKARLFIAQACVASIIIAHFTIFSRPSNTTASLIIETRGFELASAIILSWLFIRMLKRNSSRDHDSFSFRLFEYWYTIICASVITYPF